jgi:hypothetical protein
MSDKTDGKDTEAVPDNAQDLTIFVQNLLEQMVRIRIYLTFSLKHRLILCSLTVYYRPCVDSKK